MVNRHPKILDILNAKYLRQMKRNLLQFSFKNTAINVFLVETEFSENIV
jgi:hypothetical protein